VKQNQRNQQPTKKAATKILRGSQVKEIPVWECVRDVHLSEILLWCLKNGRVDTVLVSSWQSFDESGMGKYAPGVDIKAKKIFGENLIACFQARGWPGIRLSKHKGRVYVSKFDTQLAMKMAKVEDKLFSWLNVSRKKLPEDICLFKQGEKLPVLISVSHEREAWVIAQSRPPGFRRSDSRPQDLCIWPGKFFCRR